MKINYIKMLENWNFEIENNIWRKINLMIWIKRKWGGKKKKKKMGMTEETTSDFEDKSVEIMQLEKERTKIF